MEICYPYSHPYHLDMYVRVHKTLIVFVKEQRVDDYRYLYYYCKYLRCTLRKLRNKFLLRLYTKNNYDSPLIGLILSSLILAVVIQH